MNENQARERQTGAGAPAGAHPSKQRPGDRSRRERGAIIVLIALSLGVCMAFSVLAIDIGLMLLTRTQLQNAADAAALAGVSALRDGNQVVATQRAIAVAGQNMAWQDGMEPVVINDADVTFPDSRRCRVTTHRTHDTGDPLRTFFVRVLDAGNDRQADVTAVAEAEYYFICGTGCLKPWSIPDRWDDTDGDGEYDGEEPYDDVNGNDQWDPGEPFTDRNGNGQWDPEEPYDPVGTGYQPPGDVGLQIGLKIGNPHEVITPGFFHAVDFPPLHSPYGAPESGASIYRWNIANCSPYSIEVGDTLVVEPGNMQGPTRQGAQDLIDEDPGAYWDNASGTVEGSAYAESPRIVKIPFFSPSSTPDPGRQYVVIAKVGAFFIESVQGNGTVNGRFMDLSTTGTGCEPGQTGFLYGYRLVE